MAEPIFAASRMKVQRAVGFLAELRETMANYVNDNPVQITPVPAEPGRDLSFDLEWKNLGLLPGAIVGDAVHNLRTALDLMASELATMKGRGCKDVYFPIADVEANLDKRIEKTCFAKAGDDAVEILRSLKPYRGGNDLLRTLHDLDIADKHTALTAVNSMTGFAIDMEQDPNDPEKVTLKPAVLHGEINFPADSALPDEPIIETLEKMVELVEGILGAFERLVGLRTAAGIARPAD